MKKIFNKTMSYISKSITKDGKVSSTRVASYFILAGIITSISIFAGVEIVNAIVTWKEGIAYVTPNEHIVIFGMVLAHHLTLLGINKTAETKTHQATQEKLKTQNQLNPKDMSTVAPKYPETPDYMGDSENV